MNKNGMSQVGVFTPDNLIAGNRHPVDVCHVVIKAGQQLERGTVLEADAEEEGKYVIKRTQADAEYILAEAVDASEEDQVGAAYRSGDFAENALIVKEGYTLTDKDRKSLRDAGIFLSTIMM